MEEKLQKLLDYLSGCGSLVVALSGGVDSSTLLYAAHLALGEKVVAVTAKSEMMSVEELQIAKEMAEKAGVRHIIIDAHDLDDPDICVNTPERCYYCKRGRFQKLVNFAKKEGFAFVADGGNIDDTKDYRPGMRALEELALTVVSPFMICGWGKSDIRRQAKEWGLSVWDRPSAACLASRIEYGIELTPKRLRQVDAAEEILRSYISGQLRVRHHGKLARIEAEPAAFQILLNQRESITKELRMLGFQYVTLDLLGYRMGSTNEVLD